MIHTEIWIIWLKKKNKLGLNLAKLRSNWDLVSLLLFTIEDEGMPARWDQHAIGAAWQWTWWHQWGRTLHEWRSAVMFLRHSLRHVVIMRNPRSSESHSPWIRARKIRTKSAITLLKPSRVPTNNPLNILIQSFKFAQCGPNPPSVQPFSIL